MSTITRLESLVKCIYSLDRHVIELALLQIISDAKKPTPTKCKCEKYTHIDPYLIP